MRLFWSDPFFVSLCKRPSFEDEAAVIARGQRLGFNYECPGASRELVWPDDDYVHGGPSTSSRKRDDAADAAERRCRRQPPRRSSQALPLPPLAQADGWWAVDRARVRVGYGRDTYLQTRDLVKRWGAFRLPWAQVAPDTPSRLGSGVCVAARLLGGLAWTAVPLRVTVCEEQRRWPVLARAPGSHAEADRKKIGTKGRRFLLAHGCLRSHFLAGEERFAVEWRRGGGGGGADEDGAGGPVYFEVATFSRPAHPLAALGYPVVRGLQAAFRRECARDVARAAAVATVDRSTGGVAAAGPWWETEAPGAGGGAGGSGGGGPPRRGWVGLLAGLVAGPGAAAAAAGGGAAAAAAAAADAPRQRRRRAPSGRTAGPPRCSGF